MAPARSSRRILSLVSAHNSLSQRAFIALTELGHRVDVAVVDSAEAMQAAVTRHRPELIVCPMLKKLIPESIWAAHRCLVVHPGPVGDRGPSSLDWAIELGAREWGVTVLEANGDFDAGDVWATRTFPMRATGNKGSIYRHEVRRAAIDALVEAVKRALADEPRPALDSNEVRPTGQARPLMKQDVRAIDWKSDSTDTVVRKIRAAEGHPGVLDEIGGVDFHLFDVNREPTLRGAPGEIIAQRHGALCRATLDGAVWITHLRRSGPQHTHFKLPAVLALDPEGRGLDVPEVPAPLNGGPQGERTYRDISYEEEAGVGYLHFDFYNGAMSTEHCRRLREAYLHARSRRDTKVIVLMGGNDFFSNGIHLNVIEAADDPAAESWRNLHAINDVVREIVETESHLVVSALSGDAAAGGVPFALAADRVYAREDVVLNPYYRHMGGLYGSEYWTYLLPRRVGAQLTAELTGPPFTPIGTARALQIGLIDAEFGATVASFQEQIRVLARRLALDRRLGSRLEAKRRRRARDERVKPLRVYRAEEMARAYECFFGPDPSYHDARRRFTRKLGAAETTSTRPSPRLAA
jgi:putative two-component system protein, hydrogenase maturation factor HypX/HoxX